MSEARGAPRAAESEARAMTRSPPDALLLLTASCPFCPTVLEGLSGLIKRGVVGRLEVVNLEQHPEVAQALGVRSVPWVRLGPFELDGLRSAAELEVWARRVGSVEGLARYLDEMLATGGLSRVIDLVRRDPQWLEGVVQLAADAETSVHVRIGIAALLEELKGEPRLARLVEPLGRLTRSRNTRTRSDAAHYLGLIGTPAVVPYLESLLADPDAEVRGIAAEALAALKKP